MRKKTYCNWSDESSSDSLSSNSGIHWDGNESNFDADSNQYSNRIQKVKYVSNINENN